MRMPRDATQSSFASPTARRILYVRMGMRVNVCFVRGANPREAKVDYVCLCTRSCECVLNVISYSLFFGDAGGGNGGDADGGGGRGGGGGGDGDGVVVVVSVMTCFRLARRANGKRERASARSNITRHTQTIGRTGGRTERAIKRA